MVMSTEGGVPIVSHDAAMVLTYQYSQEVRLAHDLELGEDPEEPIDDQDVQDEELQIVDNLAVQLSYDASRVETTDVGKFMPDLKLMIEDLELALL